MRSFSLVSLALVGVLGLTGCATDMGYSGAVGGYDNDPGAYSTGVGYGGNGYYGDRQGALYGRVTSVRQVQLGDGVREGPGLGAALGAVIGGLAGHQIGDGSGRTAATIGGAVAGGYIGDRVQRNNSTVAAVAGHWGQEVQVHLDNGDRVVIDQPGQSLYVGARVRVSGYGRSARATLANSGY